LTALPRRAALTRGATPWRGAITKTFRSHPGFCRGGCVTWSLPSTRSRAAATTSPTTAPVSNLQRLGGLFGFELGVIILSAARLLETLHKKHNIFLAAGLHGVQRASIMVMACTRGAGEIRCRARRNCYPTGFHQWRP